VRSAIARASMPCDPSEKDRRLPARPGAATIDIRLDLKPAWFLLFFQVASPAV